MKKSKRCLLISRGFTDPAMAMDDIGRLFRYLPGGAAAALVLAASVAAAEQPVVEGRHYEVIEATELMPMPEGKVQIREFFWYGCPHCYSLEPYVEKWEKPDFVDFVMTPVMLGQQWVDHAYAFYALQQLGRGEDLHMVLFDALHKDGKRLFTISQIAGFLEGYGVKRDTFEAAAKSFLVATEVKRADRLSRLYQISGVPAFVVGGKYKTSPSMAGSYEKLFEVLDYLARKEYPPQTSPATRQDGRLETESEG